MRSCTRRVNKFDDPQLGRQVHPVGIAPMTCPPRIRIAVYPEHDTESTRDQLSACEPTKTMVGITIHSADTLGTGSRLYPDDPSIVATCSLLASKAG